MRNSCGGQATQPQDPPNVLDFTERHQAAVQQGQQEGRSAAYDDVLAINELFGQYTQPHFRDLHREVLTRRLSFADAQAELFRTLAKLGGEPEPLAGKRISDDQQRAPDITVGAEAAEKAAEAMTRALDFRCNLFTKDEYKDITHEMRANEFGGMTVAEMAREYCGIVGESARGSRSTIVTRMLRHDIQQRSAVGHTTGSFTELLANVANKSLIMGYEEAPETWQQVSRIGNLNDYKLTDRPKLSAFSGLDVVAEGGEYTHGKLEDNKETIQAKKYGKLAGISREAIINDDLNALSAAPRAMGRAANRKVGDVVYAEFTANSGLGNTLNEDGVALFDAAHSNIGTGGVISTASWNNAQVLMGLQKDLSSSTNGSNAMPTILLCPITIRQTALELARSSANPSASQSGVANVFQGAFEVVSDPRLDAASTARWYALASPGIYDVIEVAFVEGRREPQLEEQDGWTVDGVTYKVRHEFGVAVLDFRFMLTNAGA